MTFRRLVQIVMEWLCMSNVILYFSTDISQLHQRTYLRYEQPFWISCKDTQVWATIFNLFYRNSGTGNLFESDVQMHRYGQSFWISCTDTYFESVVPILKYGQPLWISCTVKWLREAAKKLVEDFFSFLRLPKIKGKQKTPLVIRRPLPGLKYKKINPLAKVAPFSIFFFIYLNLWNT